MSAQEDSVKPPYTLRDDDWRQLGHDLVRREQHLTNVDQEGALDLLEMVYGLGRHSMTNLLHRADKMPSMIFRLKMRGIYLHILERSKRRTDALIDREQQAQTALKGKPDAALAAHKMDGQKLLVGSEN